jgi:hypothetical protein
MSRRAGWVALMGVGSGCPDGGCEDGEVLTAGGECVAGDDTETPWVTGVLDGFQTRACEPEAGDGSLDLVGACALGGCRGDTYAALLDAWGVGVDCDTIDGDEPFVACDWANGLGMHFDGTGPSPADDAIGTVFTVESPFLGTTDGGLGVGVSLGCYVEALGAPESVVPDSEVADLPSSATWRGDVHFTAFDFGGNGAGTSDGFVDQLLIYGD